MSKAKSEQKQRNVNASPLMPSSDSIKVPNKNLAKPYVLTKPYVSANYPAKVSRS
jgi:hypothetical protein